MYLNASPCRKLRDNATGQPHRDSGDWPFAITLRHCEERSDVAIRIFCAVQKSRWNTDRHTRAYTGSR